MTTHIYTGGENGDHFYEGLPAQDLNESDLTDEQKRILVAAVVAGHYRLTTDSYGNPVVEFAEPADDTDSAQHEAWAADGGKEADENQA